MPLRIGCDLDGTLADLDSAFQREADQLFGPRSGTGESAVLGKRQLRALWTHIGAMENFWMTLAEAEPGAVAQLAAAAAAGAWEIIFLTQRPASAGDTTQRQSQQWLEAHGFDRPSVFVVSGSRGKIAAALDLHVVLDDRPENCADVITDSDAASMLIWRQQPERVPPGVSRLQIDVLYSMADAVERMQQLDRRHQAPRGVFDRIRHRPASRGDAAAPAPSGGACRRQLMASSLMPAENIDALKRQPARSGRLAYRLKNANLYAPHTCSVTNRYSPRPK
jgi:hypothetical protein